MALSTRESDAMIAAAAGSGATLAVGMEFRHMSDFQFVKRFLGAGLLGAIRSFDMRMGVIFDWPLETDYLLYKEKAGGGVLMDFGVHLLDLLLWWLGDYTNVRYADDARGGVEANCTIEIELMGAAGTVELSRTRNLRNSFIVSGERGRLEVALWTDHAKVRLLLNDGTTTLSGHVENKLGVSTCEQAFTAELEDFAGAIQERRAPLVSGCEARKSIELIQTCYENRRNLRLPWSF
jgi:predicted dehydrogenase